MEEKIELTEDMKSELREHLYRKHELELELEKYNIDLKGFLIHSQHELGIPFNWVLDTDSLVFIPPPKEPTKEAIKSKKQKELK